MHLHYYEETLETTHTEHFQSLTHSLLRGS